VTSAGADRAVAFAPGRVNLIGEHTDYNGGLALPFAIDRGVTVVATAIAGDAIEAVASDLGEHDRFSVAGRPDPVSGWRAFVRGMAAELAAEGHAIRPARLEISGDLERGGGLSSSAALSAALGLALLAHGGEQLGDTPGARLDLARVCSRVENDWVGARTGLLDQLAVLHGDRDRALRIDFRDLSVEPVPLDLGDWRLVTVDSGERRSNAAAAGYNDRRAECAAACEALGVETLREADPAATAALPEPLAARARHVIEENARVDAAVTALAAQDLPALGRLLDASHASLRDLYDASTPAVESTVAALRTTGAAGARMVGGGFGGHVLALLAPDVAPPPGATLVTACPGARLLAQPPR
jgi:galactokinase